MLDTYEIDLSLPAAKVTEALNSINSTVTRLKLVGLPSDQTVQLVIGFLKANNSIQCLVISSKKVWSNYLKDFEYAGNLQPEHLLAFYNLLAKTTSITEICFHDGRLSAEGLKKLAELYSTNPVLQTLRLTSCQIGREILQFAQLLSQSKNNLRYLDLSNNCLDSTAAQILVGLACSPTSSLEAINLASNHITDAGALLLHDLSEITNVKVNLESNRLSNVLLGQCKTAFFTSPWLFSEQNFDLMLNDRNTSHYFQLLPADVIRTLKEKIYGAESNMYQFFRLSQLSNGPKEGTLSKETKEEKDLAGFRPK